MTIQNVDTVRCKYCNGITSMRQSEFTPNGEYKKWTKLSGISAFFLCYGCTRVVEVPSQELAPSQVIADDGVTIEFHELPIQCTTEGCGAQATLYLSSHPTQLHGVSDTTSNNWRREDFHCPNGHPFPSPAI